mgnify:CR=1
MEHHQEAHACKRCGLEFVVDVLSFGTPHQNILAVTCMSCCNPEALFKGPRQIDTFPKEDSNQC